MAKEHKYKDKDDYKDEDKEKDKDKNAKRITETLNSVLQYWNPDISPTTNQHCPVPDQTVFSAVTNLTIDFD